MANEESTKTNAKTLPKRRNGIQWREYVWPAIWIGFVLLVLGSCLLPPVVANREAMERIRCNNNLKKIGLAMLNYQSKYGVYPPAYTVDKQGRRMHSWRALLLEFFDTDLYPKYDFGQPWNSPGNLAVAKMMKPDGPYRCPSEKLEDSGDSTWTSYVMLVGPRAFGNGSTGRKPKEITDKADETLAVVEMSPSGIVWTAPYDLNTAEMSFVINDRDRVGPRSCHPGGANFVLADASVRFLSTQCCNEETLKALATINGGEAVKPPD
jgi:prepilin-type processing-associated H-X9-DG protein